MKNEFINEVNKYFECLTEDLTIVLEKIITHDYPKEVKTIEFQIFSDSFTEGFPIQTFFLDEDNCEYFIMHNGKATYPCSVEPELLEIDYVYPLEFEEKYENNAEFELWELVVKEFIKWFSSCWLNAGGEKFQIRSVISVHDFSTEYNLNESKWEDID